MTKTPVTQMADVSMKFGDFNALDRINLQVHQGEIIALIGSSGSGKTSVLRAIIGLEEICAGQIYIENHLVSGQTDDGKVANKKDSAVLRRQKVGMVFQTFNLFPHRTVIENIVEAPIYVRGQDRKEALEEARVLLQRVGSDARVRSPEFQVHLQHSRYGHPTHLQTNRDLREQVEAVVHQRSRDFLLGLPIHLDHLGVPD